jgi:hypothetical protein
LIVSEPPSAGPPAEPQQQPVIMMPAEEFAGKWANEAILQRSPHEITLDFVRMGPQFLQGQVVARISFSPLLFSKLVDMFNEGWNSYIEDAGIPT